MCPLWTCWAVVSCCNDLVISNSQTMQHIALSQILSLSYPKSQYTIIWLEIPSPCSASVIVWEWTENNNCDYIRPHYLFYLDTLTVKQSAALAVCVVCFEGDEKRSSTFLRKKGASGDLAWEFFDLEASKWPAPLLRWRSTWWPAPSTWPGNDLAGCLGVLAPPL